MTAYTFCIDSVVRGYHDYQSIWDNSTYFVYEKRTGNSHNLQAVAIKKMINGTLQVVGCMQRKMSLICSMLLEEVAVLHSHETYPADL